MAGADAYAQAFKLMVLGYSVIPVRLVPDDSKQGKFKKVPLVRWTPYQTQAADADTLAEWQRKFQPTHWGVVTGAVSGCFVLDADTDEARLLLATRLGPPHVTTPRGGAHWYVARVGPARTATGVLPGIDVRGDGGFATILGPGYDMMRMPITDALVPFDALPEGLRLAVSGSKKPSAVRVGDVIEEGHRNNALVRLGGKIRRTDASRHEIEAALLVFNAMRCRPPLPEQEVRDIAESVARYPSHVATSESVCMYERDTAESATKRDSNVTDFVTGSPRPADSLARSIRGWVEGTGGRWWTTRDLDSDVGVASNQEKDNRRQVIHRLLGEGVIQQHAKIARQYRFVNRAVTHLNFKAAKAGEVLDLHWPLGIEGLVNLYPGNIAVVAGAPNAGKTALLLDFIRLNMDRLPIRYFCSEMEAPELRDRLELFPGMAAEEWHFDAVQRATDFEQVIVPDCINVVDYLEMTEDLYLVNTHLTAIQHVLGSGLAVVAIQKKKGALYGRGQEFSLEKPRLYLSMDAGKLTIVKGKSWAKKGCNPNGLSIKFAIANGCEFETDDTWRNQ